MFGLACGVAWMLTLSGACATSQRHLATVSVVTAHATLSAVQDTEMLLVCGRETAPQPPSCVSVELHHAISAKLARAFEYDGKIASLVHDVPVGAAPNTVEVARLLADIGGIVQSVLTDLPAGAPATEKLKAALAKKETW
jgi:hypothetical protein